MLRLVSLRNLAILVMRMKQDTILMEEISMGVALLWNLQEGDHEELVELENI